MSEQHCENYDIKRETAHCSLEMLTTVARAVEGGLMLSLESQRVCFCFVLPYNKSTSSRETPRFEGKKIGCSLQDQSLIVDCLTLNLHECKGEKEVIISSRSSYSFLIKSWGSGKKKKHFWCITIQLYSKFTLGRSFQDCIFFCRICMARVQQSNPIHL